MGQELRQHLRFKDQIRIRFKLQGGSAMTKKLGDVEALTKDLSEGGLFLTLEKQNISGTGNVAIDNFLLFKSLMDIQIFLPDEVAPVKAQGKAVWIEKEMPGQEYHHGVAVAFTEIDGRSQLAIKRHIEGREKGPGTG